MVPKFKQASPSLSSGFLPFPNPPTRGPPRLAAATRFARPLAPEVELQLTLRTRARGDATRPQRAENATPHRDDATQRIDHGEKVF